MNPTTFRPISHASFADLKVRKRDDLQRLPRSQIEALGDDRYVLREEFGDWEDSGPRNYSPSTNRRIWRSLRRSEPPTAAINDLNSGSATLSIRHDNFYRIHVVVPPEEIQSGFGKIAGERFSKMFESDRQCRMLATQRDTLLPKLLSGELSITVLDAIGTIA